MSTNILHETDEGCSTKEAARTRVAEALVAFEIPLTRAIRVFLRVHHAAHLSEEVNERAQDILQETAITALKICERLHPDSSALAWLKAIAHNHVRHLCRQLRQEKRHCVPITELNPPPLDSEDDARSEIELFDALRKQSPQPCQEPMPRLQDLLPYVPESYRQILLWNIAEGFETADIASLLNVKIGAAYTRVSRARAFLPAAYQHWKANQN